MVASPNRIRLAIRRSSALDLTLQIYSMEAVGTGLPRHPHIPESALGEISSAKVLLDNGKEPGSFLCIYCKCVIRTMQRRI